LRVLVLATAATEKRSRSWTEINPGLIFMLPPMWYRHKHMHGPPHTHTYIGMILVICNVYIYVCVLGCRYLYIQYTRIGI
jgi:hypothetical protein